MDPIAIRDEFPMLSRCTYLASHSLGAMPRSARGALARFADEWDERGVGAWSDSWWELPRALGDRIGRLLGAPAGSMVMQPNVTLASAVFLSACRFTPGRNRLVTTELNFPSLLYLFREMRDRDVDVHVVPSTDAITIDPDRLRDAITPATAVVAISHVLFRSGFIQDVGAIVERAHRAGAMVLLDIYQSGGIVPVDLARLGVDAAVGGCLKWLCGGPGNAFLYVHPARSRELTPALTGWQAHRDPFAFETGAIDRTEAGAARFLHGTPGIPAHRVAEAGLAIVERIGIDHIRRRSVEMTGRIVERARREGWSVRSPLEPGRRGGTVGIDPPHAYEVSRVLLERGVVIDYRPGGGIRFGPHFYNTDQEIDRALDVMADALVTGAWKAHEGHDRDTVT